jgi:hypothetical protein
MWLNVDEGMLFKSYLSRVSLLRPLFSNPVFIETELIIGHFGHKAKLTEGADSRRHETLVVHQSQLCFIFEYLDGQYHLYAYNRLMVCHKYIIVGLFLRGVVQIWK